MKLSTTKVVQALKTLNGERPGTAPTKLSIGETDSIYIRTI